VCARNVVDATGSGPALNLTARCSSAVADPKWAYAFREHGESAYALREHGRQTVAPLASLTEDELAHLRERLVLDATAKVLEAIRPEPDRS
jgi:hypothetical protein